MFFVLLLNRLCKEYGTDCIHVQGVNYKLCFLGDFFEKYSGLWCRQCVHYWPHAAITRHTTNNAGLKIVVMALSITRNIPFMRVFHRDARHENELS